MSNESLPRRAMKKRPLLIGYIFAVAHIALMWQVGEWLGWIR